MPNGFSTVPLQREDCRAESCQTDDTANTGHDLYLFLDRKEKDKPFPYKDKRVHLKYVWAGNNLLSNLFLVPFVARTLDLDIFIFQNFAPFFSNFKRYSFVHDVIFKSHPEYYTFV